MPDWKKEIKLSDLIPSRKKKGGPTAAAPAPAPQATASMAAATKRQAKRARGGGRHAQLLGLKIGSSQLSAALVSNNGAAKLSKLVREPLDDGLVAAGEVRDREALAAALDAFFAKHDLPRRGVRLGLASTRIGVRAYEISGIEDDKQLANAIMFRAQETLPIPFEDAVVDYQLLSDVTDEEGVRTCRALLVVAYRELVDAYVDACVKAGIELVGIDLEAFALLRALGAPLPEGAERQEGALVAVSVGHDRSTLAVSDGRTCEFTRVLQWGGGAVTAAIADALSVTPPEAERVKRSLSLDPSDEVPSQLVLEAGPAREAALKALQGFARELVSSLQFYQGQPGSLPIGEIVVTGGTADLRGLAPQLERLVGVRARVADPLARVELDQGLGEPDAPGSVTIAIGLGIDD